MNNKMKYYFKTNLNNCTFDEAIERTTAALQKEGFGVLTEIDIKSTLKKKLDVDFYNYKILGACNAPFAYQALQAEDKIGTMLPCNVILQEKKHGNIEISAVNPIASMVSIENESLGDIALEVSDKLKRVIKNI
jgi:uncharacterized protein (DUF302 family)